VCPCVLELIVIVIILFFSFFFFNEVRDTASNFACYGYPMLIMAILGHTNTTAPYIVIKKGWAAPVSTKMAAGHPLKGDGPLYFFRKLPPNAFHLEPWRTLPLHRYCFVAFRLRSSWRISVSEPRRSSFCYIEKTPKNLRNGRRCCG
jgi:hypothetical protein